MSERALSSCEHNSLIKNSCKKCGIFINPEYNDDQPFKSVVFQSFMNCSVQKYLKSMRKRQSSIENIKAKQINQSTALLIDALCEKFEYGIQTRTLGMYIFARVCKDEQSNQKFWASASLMVASKGIQLDKRVPYLNRYQRYADKNFTQEDYQLAEKAIFEQMNFDIQYSTFISFINFYLTAGVCFSKDLLDDSNIFRYLQDEICLKSKVMVRHGAFLSYQPEKLAIALIKQARVRCNLTPWKKQLEQLSGFKEQDIILVEKSSSIKSLNPLHFKNKERTSIPLTCVTEHVINNTANVKNKAIPSLRKEKENEAVSPLAPIVLSNNNSSNNNAFSSENPQQKVVKMCKKKLQSIAKVSSMNTIKQNHFPKQNSMKMMKNLKHKINSQNSNALSNNLNFNIHSQTNNLKNQTLKPGPLTFSKVSSEKMPFSNFMSRR